MSPVDDQAGRRIDQPRRHAHVLGAVLQRGLQALEHRLEAFGSPSARFFFLVLQLAQVDPPLATLCSISCRRTRTGGDSIHSSTRSVSSSTSMPFLRKISSCGLALGGRQVVGGDVVRSPPGLPSSADVVGERHAARRRACWRSAAAWPGARGWHGPRPMPSFSTAPKSFQNAAYLSRWRLVFAVGQVLQHRQHALGLPSRIALTSRLSCSSSRLTLSGRSALSMTPLTKRR